MKETYGIAAVHGGFEAGGARWSGSGQGNYSKLWSNGQVAEQEGYITKAFRLQVLDPDGAVSEEDFLEMTVSQQRTILQNANYWVDLDVVTDNSANQVSRTIAEENLKEANLTRGELVTILYRVAGEPEVTGTESFDDVAENKFYTQAVIWAAENGITNGYADGTFRPNAYVTRQEMVTFLYRFAKAEAVEEDHLTGYPDAGRVYKFAQDPMNWAIANGIINGVVVDGVAHLLPESTATRAEAAAIVARYLTAE